MIKKCDMCGKEWEDDGHYAQFTIIKEYPKIPERSNVWKPVLCPTCAWKLCTLNGFWFEFPELIDEIEKSLFGIRGTKND